MIDYIKSLPKEKVVGVASLVGSSAFNVLAGVLISHFIAKMISPEDYGGYYYAINLIASACVFLSFGAFYTTSRLILLAGCNLSVRRLHGVSLKLTLALSVFISILLLLAYFFDTGLVDESVRPLILLAPLGALVTLLNSYFEVVLPADNRLGLIAKARLYPKMLYGLIVVGAYYLDIPWVKGAFELLFFYFLASFICYSIFSIEIRPDFRGGDKEFKSFFRESRTYGIHVYLGSIFSVGGTALTGVAIGLLSDSRADVGYYALATSLCAPLSILPAALVTASFSGFTNLNCISKGLFIATASISILAAVVLCGLSDYVVEMLWGGNYFKVSEYVYMLTAAFVLYALSDLINRFLAAKGNGPALRNSSFIVGIVLIVSTFTLVDQYGGIGAAYARVAAGVAYIVCMVVFYKKQISTA
ncbi:hypothetical protein [Zoogloea sp.]|uniref:hypothetical protein n=1 Tax=Zoogloea sp. TaxID=49181 RepID=UPI0035ADC6B5